jgi:hypothetical protein
LTKLLRKKKIEDHFDLTALKKSIYSDLYDVISDESEVDVGRLIGKGASSEVFFGNFRFCPCAVKTVKLPIMNVK